MNAIPPADAAAAHTRMLLIAAGLTEDEADRFIRRLTAELTTRNLDSHEERLKFVEHELSRLEQAQIRAHGGSSELRALIIGVVSSLAATVIYDVGKAVVHPVPTVKPPIPEILPPVPPDQAEHIIRVEWACSFQTTPGLQLPQALIDAVVRTLHWHEWTEGSVNPLCAVYLDGIGMLLDRRGRHRLAERYRRQAVKVSQKANGPSHQSTGAALSNLGVCLAAQRKYVESDQCLAKGMRILRDQLGDQHIQTAGAIFNLFESLYVQGRIAHAKLPPELLAKLPEVRRFGTGMNALKTMLVLLIFLTDLFRQLMEILPKVAA